MKKTERQQETFERQTKEERKHIEQRHKKELIKMNELLKRAEKEKAEHDLKNKKEFQQLMKEAEESKQALQSQFLESQREILQSHASVSQMQQKRLAVMEDSYKMFSEILGKFINTLEIENI